MKHCGISNNYFVISSHGRVITFVIIDNISVIICNRIESYSLISDYFLDDQAPGQDGE